MVASNPLFRGGMSVKKKFASTVINDIWPEMIFFTLVATMVSLVDALTDVKMSFQPTLLTALGTVLALVISFRTSPYNRYASEKMVGICSGLSLSWNPKRLVRPKIHTLTIKLAYHATHRVSFMRPPYKGGHEHTSLLKMWIQ
ncbi:hypothetical protein PQX77_020935 [Marasmius sp. AFHP31]|nr:hypothetical protein PQX77_020935 [Marasmius sp. AFHP31]